MKVAIVHDWLVNQRGGENVLDAICELFPRATLFTLLYKHGVLSENIIRLDRKVSLLQKVPSAFSRYRHFLPLMPKIIERFDLSGYDVVISSSHCVAKGVIKRPDAFHVSYVHAPMRYMWDRFDEYFSPGRYGPVTRFAANFFRSYLQKWDRSTASRVDHFVANSQFIASKIEQHYGRPAQVIYPFCDQDFLEQPRRPGENYLIVTALVPYKRVDLAIEAFNRLKKPLVIVGDGPDKERLQKISGPTIDFLGPLKRQSLSDLYAKCKALVFPGIEDFGIVPLEAMACGAPVLAFGQGGVLETVTPKTGMFFNEHSVEGLIAGVEAFEARVQEKPFLAEDCKARAKQFSREQFQRQFIAMLRKQLPTHFAEQLFFPEYVTKQLQRQPELESGHL